MTIQELIQRIDEIKRDWPGGINFKTKSRFIGFSHPGLGGVKDVLISIEMLESDKWGTNFGVLDKELLQAIGGLFEALSPPADKEIMRAGFDHPCRETCSGWRQGYDRGRFESSERIEFLKIICRHFSRASKNKHTKMLIDSFKHEFQVQ